MESLEIPLWSKPIAPIYIRCDSVATLAKAYIQMYNGKSRHLGVRHSMIRKLITNGLISIKFVRSQQKLVDHLTKGLARDLVIKSAEGMGINWKYLDFVLHNLGLGITWRSWIKACLESSRTSILVNGSPTSVFLVKRRLRQGDPLSPFLFILVMEGLHMSLLEATQSGLIRGFLSCIGLKINIHKSYVYGVGVSDNEVHTMANNTGCSPGSFPFVYLGLPIGANMNLTTNWKILIDRFDARLSKWKANLLSIGGRLTLIKSILGSLASLDKGGLGIESLKSFNLALLQKWRWRMISNAKALWVKVIKAFHGQEGGFGLNDNTSNGVWSKIVGSSNYLHSAEILPIDSIRFQVGCGTSTRFWKDLWTDNAPLYIRYNKLFQLEQEKDCLIWDRLVDNQWTWNWSRSIMGARNTAYLNDLINEISHTDFSPELDACCWTIAKDGAFSVSSTQHHTNTHLLPSLDNQTQWDKTLPRKVNVFMWRLMLDRLPHRLNLSSCGIDIPSISCPSCNGNVESSNHIFFDCVNAKDIWNLVRNWCGILFPTFTSFEHWKD
ncbi:RNA-directed DNA polymerase, eukaryota, reverse transcriptase zinc-binding domain protein [Tanacetum coccineum]